MPDQIQIDVATINEVLRLLDEEIAKYNPGGDASIALWKFKQKLSQ